MVGSTETQLPTRITALGGLLAVRASGILTGWRTFGTTLLTISTSPPALSPLWHSTESSPLTQVVAPISASTSTNSADWHLGVLRLPGRTNDPAAEDWYFSGVYVESGSLTTAIGNGSVSPPVSSSTLTSTTRLPTSTSTSTSSTKTSTTSVPTPTSAAAQKYGQCSGNGWTSATQCVVDHDLHVLE